MRNITQEAIIAFNSNTKFSKDNTVIEVAGELTKMFLFGNLIAEKSKDGLFITNAGWATNTTKERLNAIPGVSIYQKKRTWYLNGKEWDGKRIKIK